MNRLRLSLLAAVCATVFASTPARPAPAPSARSALEQVPASAPLVFHLRGVGGTHDRLIALMKQALPDVLTKYQTEIDDFFEKGPNGVLRDRKLRGLVKDGPAFYVFLDVPNPNNPDSIEKIAVIVAVTNYKEFRDNILTDDERKNIKDEGKGIESATIQSKTTYFVDRKGYAVVTPDKDVAESFTKKITGLHTKLSKEAAAKLLAGDLGLYVNMEAVNKEYGDQIKTARQQIERGLDIAAQGDEARKKAAEMFKKIFPPVFQAIDDMQAVLMTVELRTSGLALHVGAALREDTETARLLKDSRPVAFEDLQRMPSGRAYYGAYKTSAALYRGLGALMAGVPLGKNGEESKAVAAALEELAKAGPNTRIDGLSVPMAGLQVHQYEDPAKAVAALLTFFKALAVDDATALQFKEKPVVKKNAQKHGDFQLNTVELVWDFDKMAEKIPEQGRTQYIEAMKSIMGEKKTLWFGTDGKVVVVVVASKWDEARKLLDHYGKSTGTVGGDKAFQDVRKQMPARASFLGLIDVMRLFSSIFEIVKPFLPADKLPPGWPDLPAKQAPSFVGLSLTLQPGRGSLDVYLPAKVVLAFYKAVVKPLVKE